MQHETETIEGRAAICSLAIERRLVLAARYNGAEIELHPHQLVERNGVAYLRAVNPAKSLRSDEISALGFFHLGGLGELALRPRTFDPLPPASLEAVRDTDVVLATL
jgi:hypothetical protein